MGKGAIIVDPCWSERRFSGYRVVHVAAAVKTPDLACEGLRVRIGASRVTAGGSTPSSVSPGPGRLGRSVPGGCRILGGEARP